FQTLEPVQNDGYRLTRSDIADNSAHKLSSSLRDLDLILFDYRICQYVSGQGVDFLVRLLPGDSRRQRDIEELALPHVRDALISQTGQRRTNSLTLRIENGSFQGNKYAGPHASYYIRKLNPPAQIANSG